MKAIPYTRALESSIRRYRKACKAAEPGGNVFLTLEVSVAARRVAAVLDNILLFEEAKQEAPCSRTCRRSRASTT